MAYVRLHPNLLHENTVAHCETCPLTFSQLHVANNHRRHTRHDVRALTPKERRSW